MKRKLSLVASTALAATIMFALCNLPASFAGDSWHEAWNPAALPGAADSICTHDSGLYTGANTSEPSPWSAGCFEFTAPGDELPVDAETVDTWEMRHPPIWCWHGEFFQPLTLEQALGLAPITPIPKGFRGRQ